MYPCICRCLRLSVKYLTPAAWWPVHPCVPTSVCLYLSVCVPVFICLCAFIYLSAYLCVHIRWLSAYPCICVSAHIHVFLSKAGGMVACLSVYPNVCVPVFVSTSISVAIRQGMVACLSLPIPAVHTWRLSAYPCVHVSVHIHVFLPRPAARWPLYPCTSARPYPYPHPRLHPSVEARPHGGVSICASPNVCVPVLISASISAPIRRGRPGRHGGPLVRPAVRACARGDPPHPRSDVAYFTTVLYEIEVAALSPRERQSTQASAGRSVRPTERLIDPGPRTLSIQSMGSMGRGSKERPIDPGPPINPGPRIRGATHRSITGRGSSRSNRWGWMGRGSEERSIDRSN